MEIEEVGRKLLQEEEEGVPAEVVDSFTILTFLILLSLTIAAAYMLERTKFKLLHETFIAILLGSLPLSLNYKVKQIQIKSKEKYKKEYKNQRE